MRTLKHEIRIESFSFQNRYRRHNTEHLHTPPVAFGVVRKPSSENYALTHGRYWKQIRNERKTSETKRTRPNDRYRQLSRSIRIKQIYVTFSASKGEERFYKDERIRERERVWRRSKQNAITTNDNGVMEETIISNGTKTYTIEISLFFPRQRINNGIIKLTITVVTQTRLYVGIEQCDSIDVDLHDVLLLISLIYTKHFNYNYYCYCKQLLFTRIITYQQPRWLNIQQSYTTTQFLSKDKIYHEKPTDTILWRLY